MQWSVPGLDTTLYYFRPRPGFWGDDEGAGLDDEPALPGP